MKAARLHAYQSAASLRYEDAPGPRAGAGEVLVRVHAAGVTPTELIWVPSSVGRDGRPRPLPLIPGHEFSGEVAAVGSGVHDLAEGDAVFGLNDWFADGATAEYCVAKASELARKPAPLDHVHAAVVPISGLTAWQGLFDRAGLRAGERVLIHGGAGAVGIFAVQLARGKGAHVIATASGHNVDFVRGLGADAVIDYRTTRFEDVARDIDVVFDGVGGDTLARSRSVVRAGGRLVTIAASSEGTQDQATKDAFFIVEANGSQLAELARLIGGGELRVVVDRTFSLADARAAYEYRARRGKAVVAVR
jgi:NADPH:quinone reductase-like Zn-dependent oxidoreductase